MVQARGSDTVVSGLENLLGGPESRRLKGLGERRVGLLANPTSVTRSYDHAIEALQAAGVTIARLFGPEHGVRADAQDMEAVACGRDPVSGIEVVSLYGHDAESLEPALESVADLDLVIADIQDIGARYYTYAYSVGLLMKACGRADVPVWVLDRPNPLGGVTIEGNIVEPACASFVGMQPIATRHAMTLGELARYFDRHGAWSCELEVIPMAGWSRAQRWEQTRLPWVMPSPNMPTLDTAIVYPGLCLLEGTNVSEARGTTRPFEMFGAPFLDARALCERLRSWAIPGAAWREAAFRPMFQKHAGQTCSGAQLHVTDRDALSSVLAGLAVLCACRDTAPEAFAWRDEAYEFVEDKPAIDLLLGSASIRRALEGGADPYELEAMMNQARGDFEALRDDCLIYR